MARTGLEKSLKKHHILETLSSVRRGLFVLWGGWGKEKESVGHDGKGKSLKIGNLWDILEKSLNFSPEVLDYC